MNSKPQVMGKLGDVVQIAVNVALNTGKNNGFPFLDIFGYFWVFKEYP